jgi:hypothetical protein
MWNVMLAAEVQTVRNVGGPGEQSGRPASVQRGFRAMMGGSLGRVG